MTAPRASSPDSATTSSRATRVLAALSLAGQGLKVAIIERENQAYVSLCPELDVASQGTTIEEAHSNLREAVELFLETASESEIEARRHDEVFVTRLEVSVG